MNNMSRDLAELINDSLSNKVALFNENAAKYADQAIREAFFDILEDNKLTWQNWRAHKTQCFEVMETVLNTNLPLAWENSSFYDQFVEVMENYVDNMEKFYSILQNFSISSKELDDNMGNIIHSVEFITSAMGEGSTAIDISAENATGLVDKMNEVQNAVNICREVSSTLEDEIRHFISEEGNVSV